MTTTIEKVDAAFSAYKQQQQAIYESADYSEEEMAMLIKENQDTLQCAIMAIGDEDAANARLLQLIRRNSESSDSKQGEASSSITSLSMEQQVDKLYDAYRKNVHALHVLGRLSDIKQQTNEIYESVEKLGGAPAVQRLCMLFRSEERVMDDDDEDDDVMRQKYVFESDQKTDRLQQLFHMDSKGNTTFNERVLSDMCVKIGKRKVVIISTSGKFRQGKSFWMNVLLHGLTNNGNAAFLPDDVIGGNNGVHFKMSWDAHTKGIMIWPEPLFLTVNGEEMAYIVLDTQGTFDTETDTAASAVIFALSLLMSSYQVLNTSGFIGSNDLDALNVFIEFSKSSEDRVGQDFGILMRDIPDENKDGKIYGLNPKYLEDIKRKTDTVPQLKQLLEGVFRAFEKVECCMVPHPSRLVSEASKAIAAKDCGTEFLSTLSEYATHILHAARPKLFKETALTGLTLLEYATNLFNTIRSKECHREIASAFDATVKLYFERAANAGKACFVRQCDQYQIECSYEAVPPANFNTKMADIMDEALKAYKSIQCFGGAAQKTAELEHFTSYIRERISEKSSHNAMRYKEGKISSAVDNSYSIYDKSMKPDLLTSLQGSQLLDHVRNSHESSRKKAMEHFDSEVSEFADEDVIKKKRALLQNMIKERYEDLQTNNAIQGIQEDARNLIENIVQQHHELLNAALERITDEESVKRELEIIELKLNGVITELCGELLRNAAYSKLDSAVVNSFIENFCTSRLPSQKQRLEAHFRAQANARIESEAIREQVKKMKEESLRREEDFQKQKQQYQKQMENNEHLIEEERERARVQLENERLDREHRRKIEELRVNNEINKAEKEIQLREKEIEMENTAAENRFLLAERNASNRQKLEAEAALEEKRKALESEKMMREQVQLQHQRETKRMEYEKDEADRRLKMEEDSRKEKAAAAEAAIKNAEDARIFLQKLEEEKEKNRRTAAEQDRAAMERANAHKRDEERKQNEYNRRSFWKHIFG